MRVHTDFAAAFTPGASFRTQSGQQVTASVREVGELPLTTGRVAFGEPSDALAMKTFVRQVAAGRYLVELSVSGTAEPAAARIRFSELHAVRWDPALCDGEALDELGPGEFFGAYVGNRARAAFLDAGLREARLHDPVDPIDALPDWGVECDARCIALSGGHTIAVFSTPGPGTYAAYWGFTEHHDLAELVVDLNGFLENDYVDLVLDVHGSAPRRVPIPELTRPVGEVQIIERKDCLVVEVAQRCSSELNLRGYKKISRSESMIARYEFAPDTVSIKATANFGLKRMARRQS